LVEWEDDRVAREGALPDLFGAGSVLIVESDAEQANAGFEAAELTQGFGLLQPIVRFASSNSSNSALGFGAKRAAHPCWN
jgi:hypothetical protein